MPIDMEVKSASGNNLYKEVLERADTWNAVFTENLFNRQYKDE